MAKPAAVLISDIHFSVPTLELASLALVKAQLKAVTLEVPLIICGDTMDGKAILRAECVNNLMRMLSVSDAPKTYLLVGNHDLCNEKGDDHALNFAFGLCEIVDKPKYVHLGDMGVLLIPYQSNPETIKTILKQNLEDAEYTRTVIMHQGLQTAQMGHYIQDKTSLSPAVFSDHRIISGHYHRRQDIKCGRPKKGGIGLFSYIGNPYTLNFGEANDPEKGFQILMDNGLLEFVPTNLRKHVVWELGYKDRSKIKFTAVNSEDLVWMKLYGTKSELMTVDKNELGKLLLGHSNFKLELIPVPEKQLKVVNQDSKQTPIQLFDTLIDSLQDTTEQKAYMKDLYKEILQ